MHQRKMAVQAADKTSKVPVLTKVWRNAMWRIKISNKQYHTAYQPRLGKGERRGSVMVTKLWVRQRLWARAWENEGQHGATN